MFFINLLFSQAHADGTISLPQASVIASRIDTIHDFLFWVSVFFLILVTIGMAVFVKKYHHTSTGRTTEAIEGNHTLEAIWTVGPLILMLFIFAWGYVDYLEMRKPNPQAMDVNVIGRQWLWNFEYTNGRKTLNQLVLPVGKPVRLLMSSDDVLHSFFIPNFRMKQDVVPGMYNTLHFTITEKGKHPVYCAEFCGTGHSDMLATVFALEEKDFESWLKNGKLPAGMEEGATTSGGGAEKPVSLVEKGKELFQTKGCFACHTTDGTPKVGPTLKGIFGKKEEMADGSKIEVDENYIRESIFDPQKKVVKGFPPSMPTMRGQVSEEEMNALIALIKSLKN